MALTIMPQAPQVTGVTQIRDFAPQLSDATKSNATAVQNALKLGTNIHDYAISRGQGKLLEEEENERVRILQENIANDEILLSKLEQELVQLTDGKDVENKSFWNFRTEGQ